MSVQDDARENVMVMMFNLNQAPDRARHDPDAYLDHQGHRFLFELKSTTNKSISTVRDFGPDHIEKWLEMHWIVGFFKSGGRKPTYCYYLTPLDMKEWTDQIWEYVKLDFGFADLAAKRITEEDLFSLFGQKNSDSLADAKKVQKNQYSAAEYLQKCDIPGGISRAKMDRLTCPFVTASWFEETLGSRDLYTDLDLIKLVEYQADIEKINSIVLGPIISDEDLKSIFPANIVNALAKVSHGPITVRKAASIIRQLVSKRNLKAARDVEPAYSVEAMLTILRDRCRYLINRGSTLNNPHIPEEFFSRFDKITEEHAKVLREKLTDYLVKNPPASLLGEG